MGDCARTREMTDVIPVKHRAPFIKSSHSGECVIVECQRRFNRDLSTLSECVTEITEFPHGHH